MNKKVLLEKIENVAPLNLQEPWDNSGMQVDCGNVKVNKLLISLEITHEVIDEAMEHKADFILTHHPLIFDKMKKLDCNSIIGQYISRLIREGISVYAAHTNFDTAFHGNNDYLAKLLELDRIRRFTGDCHDSDGSSMGRMGDLKTPMTLKEAAFYVKGKLNLKRPVITVGDLERKVSTVGICSGSGSDLFGVGLSCGCDLFITGDVKHHQALWAKESGMAVLDAGHYGTEWVFVPNFAEQLSREIDESDETFEIIQSNINSDPFN